MASLLPRSSSTKKGSNLLLTTPDGHLVNTKGRIIPNGNHNNILYSAQSARSYASHAGVSSDTDYVAMDQYEEQLSVEDEKLQIYDPNANYDHSSNDEDETTTNHFNSSTNPVFDDLEFLHDFLEHEAKQGFFESNCFKINCKNISLLLVFFSLLAIGFYVLYYFYGDSYIRPHWQYLLKLASIPLICIAFTYGHIALALWMTFWPTEFFPHTALQWQSGIMMFVSCTIYFVDVCESVPF